MANPNAHTIATLPAAISAKIDAANTWWRITLPRETSQILITVSDATGGNDTVYYSFDAAISNGDSITTPVGVTDGTVSTVGVWEANAEAEGQIKINLKPRGPARPSGAIALSLGSEATNAVVGVIAV